MKILVGSYQCESNTFSPNVAKKENFYRLWGEDAKNELVATRVFEAEGFDVIPLGYAVALPSGSVCREDYLEMLSEFLAEAEKHKDADGVYLYFHGAMYVDGIGSGEEYFVKRLREVIGNEIPISVASDFHSNVSDGLRENIQALSGFRTAPHTDYDETETRAANALVRILKEKLKPTLHLFRIKVLFADAAQTAGEPYRTLLAMLREAEKDPHVISASIYNGQPWVDAEFVGACVAVSLAGDEGEAYAKFKAIADYYEAHKTDMKFDMPALSPDATVRAMADLPKPVFISDSGDNSTAGADGESTFLLGKMLGGKTGRGLVASLFDEKNYGVLSALVDGGKAELTLAAKDSYSETLTLSGTVVRKGVILGFVGERVGEGVLFETEQGIDVIFSNARTSFTTEAHFSEMGVDPADYDWVALKMGYLWPGVDGLAKSRIFCLTPGSSTNDFSTLDYKNLCGEYYYIRPDNA